MTNDEPKLTVLDLGLIQRFHDRPIAAYVVRTAAATILIDTGPPRDSGADPPFVATVQQQLIEQLRLAGVSVPDIDLVICSHFDPDHAGNLDLFRGVTIVVQRCHLELARSGEVERLGWVQDQWDHQENKFWLVDGDVEVSPGVQVLATPGHIAGHQSVLVRLASGPVILAIDAITRREALDWKERPMTAFDTDDEAARASTRKLVSLARGQKAWLLRGHDAEQWKDLRTAPDSYV